MRFTALFLACYFMFGSLLPRNDFSQLLRFDDLWRHYGCHLNSYSASAPTLSFGEFLWSHLFQADDHQHQGQRPHQDLPLHGFGAGLLFVPPVTAAWLPAWHDPGKLTTPATRVTLLPADFTCTDIQPPSLVAA